MRDAARAVAAAPSSWSSSPSWSWVSRAPSPAALRRWPPGRSPRPAMSPGSRPPTSRCTRTRRPASSSTGRSWRRSGGWRPTTGATATAARRTPPAPRVRCSSSPRPSPMRPSSPSIKDADICDPVDAIPAAAAYLPVQRGAQALGPRPLPLQPGRLVPAPRHALGRPLRVRGIDRMAHGGPDHAALRPVTTCLGAAALLRGDVPRALPRRA